MPNCAAIDCPNRQCGESEKTFHLFPFSRPDVLKQWIANMKREFWTPSKRSVLCSDHFESSCFDKTGCTTRIRSDAIPTIFTPQISQQKAVKVEAKKRKKREVQDSEEDEENGEPPPSYDAKYNKKENNVETKKKMKKEVQDCEKDEENGELPTSFEARYSKRKRTQKSFDPDFVYEKNFIKRPQMRPQPRITVHQKTSLRKFPRIKLKSCNFSNLSSKENSSSVTNIHSKDIRDTSHQGIDITPSCSVKLEPKESGEDIKDLFADSVLSVEPSDVSANEITKNQEKEDLEQVKQISASVHKITPKDKVTHLPNNFIHFEFATPRRQVIVELNSKVEHSGLRCNSLSELLNSLSEKNLLTTDGENLLSAFGDIPRGLIRVNNKKDFETILGRKYSEEVKKFTSLLYLNSLGAYDIVNELYLLPNRSVLKLRLQVEDFWPGFTKEALEILSGYVCRTPQEKLCCVMFDFISVKKECSYEDTCENWIGHVDLGKGLNPTHGDGIPLASEVLIFTASGLGSDWKLPFGYFFSKGLSSEFLKNLVIEAICTLVEYGLNVRAVVCGGSRNTVKVAKLLGCSVRPDISNKIVTSFPHPYYQEKRIHFVFSVGHTLPLLRNLLEDKGTLQSSVYGEVQWSLIQQLICLSKGTEVDSSTIANPDHLKLHHLLKIIKKCDSVFNSAVIEALHLADTLKLKNFVNCRNTLNFIADVNRTFDLLNARNLISSEDRPSIHWNTLQEQVESLLNLTDRILDLELMSGKRIVEDGRWMSVALLAFTLKSVSQLASELLNEKTISYFNTFRTSLDHSEMVINHLQRHGCWNDVPTPSSFRNTYKSLFTKSHKSSFHHYDFDGEDFTVGQGDIYVFRKHFRFDHIHSSNFFMHSCSLIDLRAEEENRANILLEVVTKRLCCAECMHVIVNESLSVNSGGRICGIQVIRPSQFILHIMKYTETIFKVLQMDSNSLSIEKLVVYIFREYCMIEKPFSVQKSCQIHFAEEPFHIICLVKVIIRTFISLIKCRQKRRFKFSGLRANDVG
ncbi:uncharacterized protein [Palaemon carinicauda]|uniref:uncharacterized protein n=1 Tax=Palaemon carinicauda TaxID=392227 RepID=UPI0035B5858A